jgi:hypothetical protein
MRHIRAEQVERMRGYVDVVPDADGDIAHVRYPVSGRHYLAEPRGLL